MQINKENTKNILKEIENKSNLVIPFNQLSPTKVGGL